MKTIKIKDLNSYGKLVDRLVKQIKKSGGEYKAVYSPDNPTLAFLLSKMLELKLVIIEIYECPRSYGIYNNYNTFSGNVKNVLIVSDIINTGKTREQYKDFDFACLFYKKNEFGYGAIGFIETKTYGLKELSKDTQVILPWEKEIK